MRMPCGVLLFLGCRCVRTVGFGVPVSAGARKLWTFRLWRCLVVDPAEDAARRAYGPDWDLEYSGHLLAATQAAREALAPIRAKCEALAEKYAASPYGNPCLDVLAELAPLIYPSTELEEGSTS